MKLQQNKIELISLALSLIIVGVFIFIEINPSNILVIKSDLKTFQPYIGIGRPKGDDIYAWIDLPSVYDRAKFNGQTLELLPVTHHEFNLKKVGDDRQVELVFEKDHLNLKKYLRLWKIF